MHSYVQSLTSEYLSLVSLTDNSALSPEELHDAQSQRTVVHEQLLQALDETRETVTDMVEFARNVILDIAGLTC